jgi:2-C-methyl-D-erythritol 4-phosphate cytidylyltransferase
VKRVKVIAPGASSVGEWRRRLATADVIAVMDERDERHLGPLVAQLGAGALISASQPVTEALKVIEGGLVKESVDRRDVVALTTPYAFTVELAAAVLAHLDAEDSVELLDLLARAATPLHFRIDSAEP